MNAGVGLLRRAAAHLRELVAALPGDFSGPWYVMANKVVRRVSECVKRLGPRPAPAEAVESRDEIVEALSEGFESSFQRSMGGLPASRDTIWRSWLAGDEWDEILRFVLDGLATAGYSITKDPAVCGDYPAPCNCDDRLIHNGR